MIKKIYKKIKNYCNISNSQIDRRFISLDRESILRTKNIRSIPNQKFRKGGKISYAEWAHVIGIFQTLFYEVLDKKDDNKILDIGSGTGLLAMASEPFISGNGYYKGLDVIKSKIDFSNNHYNNPKLKFSHFNVNNATYSKFQNETLLKWDIKDNSYDLVTALSVWTHFNENDALFYLKEVERVLKKGGKAIITFFYLDDYYDNSLKIRENKTGRFHSTNQLRWIFNKKAYESQSWFSTDWAKVPEDAIGINKKGMDELILNSNLKLIKYYPGNWKEKVGLYFQDVLIFQKV